MGQSRTTKARMNFFGDCRAAHNLAPLEYERLQAGLGEIASRNQAVMTTADDDDVVISHSSMETIEKLDQPRICADERRSERLETVPVNYLELCSRSEFAVLALIRVDPRKSAAKSHFSSFSICSAAFLPGAPMMPPPGCVAEPHM